MYNQIKDNFDQLEILFKADYTNKIIISFIILFIGLFLRRVLIKIVQKSKLRDRIFKRSFIVNTNFWFSIVLCVSLIITWSQELETIALSLFAFAVAFVIASKELIMCLTGTIVKMNGNAFRIGDRIDIDGVRGDVIDRTLMTTKILEIGPGQKTNQLTGRSITIPNSVFLSKLVTNESYLKSYILHNFSVILKSTEDWKLAEEILLRECNNICGSYFSAAQRYFDHIQTKNSLDVPIIKPRVNISFASSSEILLVVRITIPAQRRVKIEQDIIRRFLEQFPKS